jgi:hypothetical protein
LVAEWDDEVISAYDVDASGNPIPDTRREFLSGIDYGPLGSLVDPLTGDLLFAATQVAGDEFDLEFTGEVFVIRGFDAPIPIPEPTSVVLCLMAMGMLWYSSFARPRPAWPGGAVFTSRPCTKHRSTQTSEGATRSIAAVSGSQTSDHGASSCGAISAGPTLACQVEARLETRTHTNDATWYQRPAAPAPTFSMSSRIALSRSFAKFRLGLLGTWSPAIIKP